MSERDFLPPGVSSSPTSFGTSIKVGHTLQVTHHQLAPWEERPIERERQGNMLLAPHWLAVKGGHFSAGAHGYFCCLKLIKLKEGLIML